MARPAADPKGVVLRIRVNEEMKEWLYWRAEYSECSVSDVVRDAVKEQMDGCFFWNHDD